MCCPVLCAARFADRRGLMTQFVGKYKGAWLMGFAPLSFSDNRPIYQWSRLFPLDMAWPRKKMSTRVQMSLFGILASSGLFLLAMVLYSFLVTKFTVPLILALFFHGCIGSQGAITIDYRTHAIRGQDARCPTLHHGWTSE